MMEVVLEGLAPHVEDGTIQRWYFEEGDTINEGDDLVALSTEEGSLTVQAPCSGVLAEVYYDEGEMVAKGEVLCAIDDSEEEDEDDEEDDDKDKDDKDKDDEE